MKSNVANVTTIMKTAYYLLTASADDMPVAIDMTIIGCGWKKELTVPLEHCHADALARKCPLLRFPNRKAKDAFDATLISNLIAGLADGSIQRGYYFEQAGANILPSGQICFVHGSEMIGACGRPYKVAPEISNTQLLGQGRPLFQLPSILANAPYQVLLVLAYVILASIRSLLISAGIDLQAVQYIVGGQGLGKTTLATRVAGIYQVDGKPAGIVQAGSTHAAVNALMTNLRDQPVIVDDLCLSASRDTARKRIDLASKLIRQATGDIPIIKQSGKTTIELPCKTGLIITAEFHLENLSDLMRCIIVPVQKQLDISNELTPDLIADAVRHYLLWFTEHAYDEIGRFRVAMDHAVNNSELDARMATNYACLDEAFRSFIRSMDGLEIPSR